jgi:RNA polymerase sigma-70 factor (ECF subfamily)
MSGVMWSRPQRPPSPPPGDRQDRFRTLFDAESRSLLGYALRRTGRPEDAADVVAEVFLVAWRRIDDVPAGDDARLWLYGVARRVLANQLRGARRRERLGDLLRDELRVAVPPEPPGDESAGAVRSALERLSADDRELLRLVAWEGLTPAAVATVTGTPAATVRTRLHRARRRLAAQLQADTGRTADSGPDPTTRAPLTPSPEEAR